MPSGVARRSLDVVTAPAPHEPRACNGALVRAFGFLGKRWNGVLLGTLAQGAMSYAELKRTVAGISDSMLSERLGELGTAGLVLRTVDSGPPVSVRYELSDSGRELMPVLDALSTWAGEHLSGC